MLLDSPLHVALPTPCLPEVAEGHRNRLPNLQLLDRTTAPRTLCCPLQSLCVQALLLAAKDRQPGSSYEVNTPEALLGAIVFDAWILQPRRGLSAASLEKYEAQCFEAATWSQREQQLAAQLEQQLLEGGFSPTISAAQLHLVRTILCHQSAAARISQTESGIFAGMIKTAGEQMVRLDRSSLGLQLRRAMFLAQIAAAPLTYAAFTNLLEKAVTAKGECTTRGRFRKGTSQPL